LSNEIGDPLLMQKVLSGTGSSNSRGRAQQILVLQQRVNELETIHNSSRNKESNGIDIMNLKMLVFYHFHLQLFFIPFYLE